MVYYQKLLHYECIKTQKIKYGWKVIKYFDTINPPKLKK